MCGKVNCTCEKRRKVRVKLADGKEGTIQHMMMTSFWHPDGTPMSAQQFMEQLYGKLPEFFNDEEQLREIWSAPDTRRQLLARLAERGFGRDQLAEMQRLLDAEPCDLFDVLAYIAFARDPMTRERRAGAAWIHITTQFSDRQHAFLAFVLQHYVNVGVEELDVEKLSHLLSLKYGHSISDAVRDLGGKPEEIHRMFVGFQRYLYAGAG